VSNRICCAGCFVILLTYLPSTFGAGCLADRRGDLTADPVYMTMLPRETLNSAPTAVPLAEPGDPVDAGEATIGGSAAGRGHRRRHGGRDVGHRHRSGFERTNIGSRSARTGSDRCWGYSATKTTRTNEQGRQCRPERPSRVNAIPCGTIADADMSA
jgi:hypothetical protein